MKLKTGILAAALFAMAAPFFAHAAETKPSANTVLATVEGTKITLGHVIALRERLPERYKKIPDDILFKGIVDQLIQQTILMKAMEARIDTKTRIGLENERRAFLAAEYMDRLSAREVPEEALKKAYAAKFDGAVPEKEYNASHILVDSKEKALEIVKLLNDGADFATLAKERSKGPSGKRGGELGWFSVNKMVKPFGEAVKSLSVGEISQPVQTRFGWHVIKLNGKRDKKLPTFEQEKDKLAAELSQKAVDEEIAKLTDAAKVTRAKVDIDPSVIRDVSLLEK